MGYEFHDFLSKKIYFILFTCFDNMLNQLQGWSAMCGMFDSDQTFDNYCLSIKLTCCEKLKVESTATASITIWYH